MKKILLSLFVLTSVFFAVNVNAEEVKIEELDANTYIVGNRVFEPTEYYLTVFDIVEATKEYLNVNPSATEVPIYLVEQTDEGAIVSKVLGAANENNELPLDELENIEDVFEDGVIEPTQVNGVEIKKDTMDADKDVVLSEKAGVLNTTANNYGFKSIGYDATENTATFVVDSTKKGNFLVDYAASGIVDLFLNNVQGFTYAEIEGMEDVDLTTLTPDKLIGVAAGLLSSMADVQVEDPSELTLGDVVGKTATAKFHYTINGHDEIIEYHLSFIEDTLEADKDVVLSEKAGVLNTTASNYGFTNILYNAKTNTATFAVNSAKKGNLLVDYAASGIVDLFLNNVQGFTYAEIEGMEDVDLTTLTPDKLIGVAAGLLSSMSNVQVEDPSELTLGDVVGKTATAKFHYTLNGYDYVIEYYLTFVEDKIDAEKDTVLSEKAGDLNTTANNYGFTSIAYDAALNTATFTVDEEKKGYYLVDYAASGIVDLFLNNVQGFTYAEIEGMEDVDLTTLTPDKLIGVAAGLLSSMSNVQVEDPSELTLESVVGNTATAKFHYNVNGQDVYVEYHLSFVM